MGTDEELWRKRRNITRLDRLRSKVTPTHVLLAMLLLLCCTLTALLVLPGRQPDVLPPVPRRPRVVLDEAPSPELVYLSWTPRIILIKNFLSDAECDHVISLAKVRIKRSSVVDTVTGKSKVDEIRTSSGTFISHAEDPVMMRIGKRAAELTMLPLEHQEAREPFKFFTMACQRMDTFHLPELITIDHGLQRVATLLTFLNTPEAGGETVFPNVEGNNSGPEWSPCARDGLAYKPQRGNAILFWSLTPANEIDMGATHAACPLLRGEKWSMPLWMHQAPFKPEFVGSAAVVSECKDSNAMCRTWERTGECSTNRMFMVGTDAAPGVCRRSCHACPYPT